MKRNRTKVQVPCSHCGKPLERQPNQVKTNNRHFCDLACRGRWQSQNRRGPNHPHWIEGADVTCEQCGKTFHRAPGDRTDGHTFCSRACRSMWMGGPPAQVPCTNCGKMINRYPYRLRDSDRQFCDNHCNGEWMSKHRIGTAHPRWTGDRTLSCHHCGKSFRRIGRGWENRNAHNFCSHRCFTDWLSQSGRMAGGNNRNWRGGKVDYYGPNWGSQSRLARKRDNYTCQVCGKRQKKGGRSHDVHHIRPFREFNYIRGENENYRFANDLTNLITVCGRCHPKVEAGLIPVQRSLPFVA